MEIFGFPVEEPEEVKAARERHFMHLDSIRHDMERLLEELDKEQLVTLRHMLNYAGGNEAYAQYWSGAIGATLKYKHGLCGCGKDHAAELLAPAGEPVVQSSTTIDEAIETYGEPFEPVNQAEFDAGLEKYNVRLPEEGEVTAAEGEMPVICKGCGMLYQSIEDRMRREPGIPGCSGCVQKQKWG